MLASAGSAAFDELVGLVYEGPVERVPWRCFLERFRGAVGAAWASLMLRPPSERDAGLTLADGSVAEQWKKAYCERYFALDPLINLPAGVPMTLQEWIPIEHFLASEYYTEYVKPMGALHVLALDVREPGGLEARLRAGRFAGHEDFGAEDKSLCARLAPHLQRALHIHGKLRLTEAERDLYQDTVDRFGVGTILLDGSGRVLRMNESAERLVGERDALVLDGKALRTGDRKSSRELGDLIEGALAARHSRDGSFARALRIQRSSGKGSIGLLVRPLPADPWYDDQFCPAVGVFIGEPERPPAVSKEILEQLFGFTRAEASVASLLVAGMSVESTAQSLGISVHTARAHLRSLFAKADVSRQTDLVLRILHSAAALGNP